MPVAIRPPSREYVFGIVSSLTTDERGLLDREQFAFAMRYLGSNLLRRVLVQVAVLVAAPFVASAVYNVLSQWFTAPVGWLPISVQCLSAYLDELQLWPPLLTVLWVGTSRRLVYGWVDACIAHVARQNIHDHA